LLPLNNHTGLATFLAACMLAGACGAGTDTTSGSTASSAVDASADATSSTTSGEAEPTSSSAAEPPSSDAASTSTSPAAETGTTSDETGDGPDEPFVLALAVDGLTIVESLSGSTTHLPFGTAKTNVLTGLESTLGAPGTASPGNAECGNGQATVAEWPDAISIDFDSADQFLSWGLQPGSELTDLAGVGLGSSFSDLSAAWDVTVSETTLGHEFSTSAEGGGLGGLLTGPELDATITHLWAGPICAFR
jgi:hypothetical protein